MRGRMRTLSLLLLLTACGSRTGTELEMPILGTAHANGRDAGQPAHDGASGPCSPRHATYALTMVAQTGDCTAEPFPETTVFNDGDPFTYWTGCVAKEDRSTDTCTQTVSYDCPRNYGHIVASETITWSPAGDVGHGNGGGTWYDGAGSVTCVSTYSVTYVRIDGG